MRYMSIITNFGCHYKCPYCIVKENNLHIPRTTLAGLDNLEEALKENGCNIVSISGGGDPLHEYEKHVDWYRKLFGIVRKCHINSSTRPIPVEMHTSYMTATELCIMRTVSTSYHTFAGLVTRLPGQYSW